MEKISIRDLHLKTGEYVRLSEKHSFIVTDHGKDIALLCPISNESLHKFSGLPDRNKILNKLPKIKIDSTKIISDDRNEY